MKAFLWVKSSTQWLTKAVDISASYLVHVVVYTSPAGQLNLTIQPGLSSTQQMRKSIQIQFKLILHTQRQLYVSCWDAGV